MTDDIAPEGGAWATQQNKDRTARARITLKKAWRIGLELHDDTIRATIAAHLVSLTGGVLRRKGELRPALTGFGTAPVLTPLCVSSTPCIA